MSAGSITINDREITSDDIPSFAINWQGDLAIPEFLESWFDTKDYFPAYTSGSTGIPTEVRLHKAYASASARATIQFLDLKPGTNALLSMPAKFIAGRMMIVRAITGQLNLIPIAVSSCPELPDQSIDLAAFTPHQFQNLIESTKNKNDLRIRNILLGGGPVSSELMEKLGDFPGRIFETFGMTETYSHVAVRMRHPVDEIFFQAVKPASFTSTDQRLIIQAPHLGLQNLRTNDLVELDGPFRFRWLGRADYAINSGGLKIIPELIEDKLSSLIHTPYFITGQADPVYGEKVVLVIQKAKNSTTDEVLYSRMNEILDKYEKPKSIIWVDTMIYTPTGKINRMKTKKHYHL